MRQVRDEGFEVGVHTWDHIKWQDHVAAKDAAWTRRVSGLFANDLATKNPGRAHAILVQKDGGYTVSVRAPTANPAGADELCLKFETGGGRKGAAGINRLPQAEFDRFIEEFKRGF